ncbi:MAG: glycine cleavage system protein GcvH [Neisseriaceae bacterium]|nr:glycine cleavage system protein GcvH [Neisseriaceae bacterium]
MSAIPQELKYVSSHTWLRLEADGAVTIGITDHAQTLLGDIVFVELPAVGQVFEAGDQAGVVESVKVASDVYASMAGEVIDINIALVNAPELVNTAPYAAWFFKIKPTDLAAWDALLTPAQYEEGIG